MPDRQLGTMITYGYPGITLAAELILAARLGATLLEILPDWRSLPDPALLKKHVVDRGLTVHSAHGCWGGQSIHATRVDLGAVDPLAHRDSVEDLKRCIDWLVEVGGTCLVVHPGGLSAPADETIRRDVLGRGLLELAEHVGADDVFVCVENMPPGVYPGSRMEHLRTLIEEIGHPKLALALDTGHAHISESLAAATHSAGPFLATTHVHDNNGRQDSHDVPGHGTIDWNGWAEALDSIAYRGPIVLECIRQLRADPSLFRPHVLVPLTR